MSTPTAIVYTLVNNRLLGLTPRAFEIANEVRARRNMPALEPISPEEAGQYLAIEEADTVPIFNTAPAPTEPLLSGMLSAAVVIAILLLVMLIFTLFIYRADHLDVANTAWEWMGTHRAAMMPIECLGALIWGLLS